MVTNSAHTQILLLKVNSDALLDSSCNGNGIQRGQYDPTFSQNTGMVYDISVLPGSQGDAATDRVFAITKHMIAKVHGDGMIDPTFVNIGKRYASNGLGQAQSIVPVGNTVVMAGQNSAFPGDPAYAQRTDMG